MEIQHQFETTRTKALQEMAQIETLIQSLQDAVERLEHDITAEEARVGIVDLANVGYPILARVLAVRRENLLATIETVEQRRAALRQIFFEPASAA
jgi:hypothetical protein